MVIGATSWWQANLVSTLPVGSALPDGSRITCKAGGTAWIVAPSTTQVSSNWGNVTCCGCISNPGGILCSITTTNWVTLHNCLITRGFNPSDWFVPNLSQLQTAGYACRFFWDSVCCAIYWSSTEDTATGGCTVLFGSGTTGTRNKANSYCVRPFRCVTY